MLEEIRNEIYRLAGRKFTELCTACGGNWYAMYWSGYKRAEELGWLTAEELDWFDKESSRIEEEKSANHACMFLMESSGDIAVRQMLREMSK